MPLPITWIERITLFKDICFKQGTQLCSACSSSGLIYYGPSNWPFRRQRSFIIIIYNEAFLYFLSEYINPETFNERCSLISRVLQGLVKICKKYMEVNNFLQPWNITSGRMVLYL